MKLTSKLKVIFYNLLLRISYNVATPCFILNETNIFVMQPKLADGKTSINNMLK